MKKKTVFIIISVVVLSVGLILFLNRPPAPKKFQYTLIEKGDIETLVSCTGTLQFLTTRDVGAQVSGTIDKLYADYNQKVKKGQKLATIDSVFYQLALDEAQANLEKARLQLLQAKKDYDDTKDLFSQNFKTQSELDTAQLNLTSAQVSLKTVQIALDRAKLNLEYATLTSPLNGVVIQRNVEIGQSVAAGATTTPPFVVATDKERMQILASVDENDISQVKPGQMVRFTVQAYRDKKFMGKVSQIRLQPAVVQNVVNYTVVIDVWNKEGQLLPGMTATIDIVASREANVLKVANAALKFKPSFDMLRSKNGTVGTNRRGGMNGSNGRRFSTNQGPDFGMLWYQDTNSGKLRPVPVKVGSTDGQSTEIKSTNITEGMQVISGLDNSTGKKTGQQQRSPFLGGGRGPGPGR